MDLTMLPALDHLFRWMCRPHRERRRMTHRPKRARRLNLDLLEERIALSHDGDTNDQVGEAVALGAMTATRTVAGL